MGIASRAIAREAHLADPEYRGAEVITVEEGLRQGYYELTDDGRWSLENGSLKDYDLSVVDVLTFCCTDWIKMTEKGRAWLDNELIRSEAAARAYGMPK